MDARTLLIKELERRGVDWVAEVNSPPPALPTLREWCENTLPHPLHDWQIQLCEELEVLKLGGRHRILMHGPPRYGKSIIVGQRLIPWLLMHNPKWRCPLMTYNIDHSTEFGEVIRDLMRSDYFKSVAPQEAWLEREDCSAKAFRTNARAATLDGDYSFRALGFQTGFTGKGADCIAEGTLVSTPDGQVRIEDLVLQERPCVFGYNTHNGSIEQCRVRASRVIRKDELVEVRTSSGRSLRCTPDHLVFVQERGYIQAASLVIGDTLVIAPENVEVQGMPELPHSAPQGDSVASVERVCGQGFNVYDIEVEGTNNFFAGEILVHNCLVGDDPYANPEDAMSEAVNGRTIRTYQNQIKLRVGADAPLIFMYHRYHERDLGGHLLDEGNWTNLRFPCIADSRDNEDGSDITNRNDGELLSDLWPGSHIQNIRETDPYIFASMYQGRPKPSEGGFIKREDLRSGIVPPTDLLVRYWDLATSVKETADWTVGALGGIGPNQIFYVKDIERFRMEWPDACARIAELTEQEAYECQRKGIKYAVGIDARLSQQGFFQQLMRQRIFSPEGEGLKVQLWPDRSPGDKKERASGWVADARHGRLILGVGPWNEPFINECLAFTGEDIDTDDQVDAVSGLHNLLWSLKGGIKHDRQQSVPGSNAWLDKLIKSKPREGVF